MSHEGGTEVTQISILAPARGATSSPDAPLIACTFISILAPARGATYEAKISKRGYKFQFSPLREGRREILCLR